MNNIKQEADRIIKLCIVRKTQLEFNCVYHVESEITIVDGYLTQKTAINLVNEKILLLNEMNDIVSKQTQEIFKGKRAFLRNVRQYIIDNY